MAPKSFFFKAGIRSVTMDDIAKHLGISKKTIYVFYQDKDEIVTALVAKKLAEDKDGMCSIAENSTNVLEELINMMKCSEEFFARVNPILIHDLQKYHPVAWKQFQAFKSEVVVRVMQDILNRGIEQGYVRPEIDTKVIARMRMWQVELGFDTTVFPASEFNSLKVQMQFLEHFIYGICTVEGRLILDNYKNLIEQQ